MGKAFFAGLIIIVLYACNGDANVAKDNVDANGASAAKDSTRSASLIAKDSLSFRNLSINDRILGIWSLVGEENANFDIRKDEIYYPGQNKSYKYKIMGDTLTINYIDYEGAFAIKMLGADTLVLTGEDEQVYIKFTK